MTLPVCKNTNVILNQNNGTLKLINYYKVKSKKSYETVVITYTRKDKLTLSSKHATLSL